MPLGDIETFLKDGQWHNRVEGADAVLSSHDDKVEAAAAGRREAQQRKVEHFVKKETGSIGEDNGHDNDRGEIISRLRVLLPGVVEGTAPGNNPSSRWPQGVKRPGRPRTA